MLHSPSHSELPELRRRVWAGAPSLWPLPPSSGVSTAATLSAAVGKQRKSVLPARKNLAIFLASNSLSNKILKK